MRVIDRARFDRFRTVAQTGGILGLGIVALDHPALRRAADHFDAFIDEGRHGTMEFLARSRAVRRDPGLMLPGARTALVGVVPHGGTSGPIARYAQFSDYHTVLHGRLQALEDALHRELPGIRTLVCVDTKPLMERAVAAAAGLGFLGKNGCLIVPGLGSYVLIGTILTDAGWDGPGWGTGPEEVRPPAQTDACGSCRRCLDACPTGAFDGPGQLDPRRCISYLTIEYRGPIDDALADRMGVRVAGCDVCQEVCPYNASHERPRTAVTRARLDSAQNHRLATAPSDPRSGAGLAGVAGLGSARYRAFVRGTPLTRIPRRSLRRNALIALGNLEGPLESSERALVDSALQDPDPQIRAAAERVRSRRGRPDTTTNEG